MNKMQTHRDATLKQLAKTVASLQSFEYDTFDAARETVNIDGAEYVFDKLSLCGYTHNLSTRDYDDTANTMTIRMTDTGLSEINEAATVYTDIKERVRMNILIVEDEVSLANALEHIMKKPVTSRMWWATGSPRWTTPGTSHTICCWT